MGSIGSVMNTGINQIVRICGNVAETAQAVFGLYFKIQSFIFMPVFGLNNGMVPIVAYNFGAKKKDRLVKTIKLAVLYACILMFIGLALFQLIPDVLLSIFSTGEESDMAAILEIGVPALRRISLSFIFAGFCIVILSVFQALGHGFLSLIVSVLRQLGVLLPAALILALATRNVQMIWFSFPIAEVASVILSALFLKKVYDKEIKYLGSNK
jgi:Na+-driven multidrug efflux pump